VIKILCDTGALHSLVRTSVINPADLVQTGQTCLIRGITKQVVALPLVQSLFMTDTVQCGQIESLLLGNDLFMDDTVVRRAMSKQQNLDSVCNDKCDYELNKLFDDTDKQTCDDANVAPTVKSHKRKAKRKNKHHLVETHAQQNHGAHTLSSTALSDKVNMATDCKSDFGCATLLVEMN
jgi:hypothetical protein